MHAIKARLTICRARTTALCAQLDRFKVSSAVLPAWIVPRAHSVDYPGQKRVCLALRGSKSTVRAQQHALTALLASLSRSRASHCASIVHSGYISQTVAVTIAFHVRLRNLQTLRVLQNATTANLVLSKTSWVDPRVKTVHVVFLLQFLCKRTALHAEPVLMSTLPVQRNVLLAPLAELKSMWANHCVMLV
jgi:hypothetical protein